MVVHENFLFQSEFGVQRKTRIGYSSVRVLNVDLPSIIKTQKILHIKFSNMKKPIKIFLCTVSDPRFNINATQSPSEMKLRLKLIQVAARDPSMKAGKKEDYKTSPQGQ